MSKTRIREVIAMAEDAGLKVVTITCSKSLKLEVRAVDGRTKMISAPWTPSCHHANANQRSMFRKFARGTLKGCRQNAPPQPGDAA